MAEEKTFEGLTEAEYAAYGYAAGRALAALIDGWQRGLADGRAEIEAANGTAVAEEEPQPPANTAQAEENEGVCGKCWCNSCFMLETCDAFQPSPDGIRSPPCAECNAKDCAPLMPKARPAECGSYKPIPEDCAACWCHECASFEECVVDKKGYAPESKPCPCDGCKKGMRYMPKEKPPTCGRFAEKNSG